MKKTIKIMAGLLVVPLVLLMSACAPDKPDPTICVSGHYYTTFITTMVGKSMSMIPIQNWDCDKYGPNPNYQSELAKWQASK